MAAPHTCANYEARRRTAALLGILVAQALALSFWGGSAAAEPSTTNALHIIAHPSNSASGVTREFLASAFLKKTTRWGGGETIRPVDLPHDSAERRMFSAKILRRSVSAVRNYWQQRIFSGRGVPPPVLETEAAVSEYVATHPGAVGYVAHPVKSDRVKLLAVNE